jgi:hypothetical protein
MGDFNEILYQHEKQGVPRPQVFMDKFQEALEDSGLDDLGYSGDTFTCRNNCHTAVGYIRERLDRAWAIWNGERNSQLMRWSTVTHAIQITGQSQLL